MLALLVLFLMLKCNYPLTSLPAPAGAVPQGDCSGSGVPSAYKERKTR